MPDTTATKWDDIAAGLNAPFAAGCVGWKPGSVKGSRASALAYIDSRDVQDRLDNVLGVGNWKDEYTVLPCGSVECRLSLRVAGEWLSKTDVGAQSEQPDGGDRIKAAFSDALKRAAVEWGIGRYLYHLESQWCDYDGQKRNFVRKPQLPPWALPGGTGRPAEYGLPPHLAADPAEPTPAPAPAAKAPPPAAAAKTAAKPTVRDEVVAALSGCRDREGFVMIWKQYQADIRNGLLTDDDVRALEPQFKAVGNKHPKPSAVA